MSSLIFFLFAKHIFAEKMREVVNVRVTGIETTSGARDLSFYGSDFEFDFSVSENDRSITLYVPKRLEGCVVKYSNIKDNSEDLISEFPVIGDCIRYEHPYQESRYYVDPTQYIFRRIALVDNETIVGIDYSSETDDYFFKYLKSTPLSIDAEYFSNVKIPSESSFFVDRDGSLVIFSNGPEHATLFRLRDGSDEPEIIHTADEFPQKISRGLNDGELVGVYMHEDKAPEIFLHNYKDRSIEDVDLVSYFQRFSQADNSEIVDIVFDTSSPEVNFAILTVAMVTPAFVQYEFEILYFLKATPENWLKLETVQLPETLNGRSTEFYYSETMSFPVAKDGVFIVSVTNEDYFPSLSFFKFDHHSRFLELVKSVAPSSAISDSVSVNGNLLL